MVYHQVSEKKMPKPMSLEDLKAQNEQEDQARQEAEAIQTESDDDVSVEYVENDETEASSAAWLADDEPDDDPSPDGEQEDSEAKTANSNDDRSVSLSKHIDVRQKLKGKLHEKDDENQQLKQRIADLEAKLSGSSDDGQIKKPQTATTKTEIDVGEKPKRADFDDEDDYFDARDEWRDKKRLAESNQKQQEAQVQKQKETVQKAVDDHYSRASKLVEKHKIEPEVYQGADKAFRQALDDVQPGKGEAIADALISMIGEESEKLVFHIGRNKQRRAELAQAIKDDPVGNKAMMLLGTWRGEIKSPGKRTTKAPAPAPNIGTGNGAAATVKTKALKKKYEKACASNDMQARIDAKFEAKKAGVDVSQW